MHAAEETRLESNLMSSLEVMLEIGAILADVQTVLRDRESDEIDQLLEALDAKRMASEKLAIERNQLLPARGDYDTCLGLFSVNDQPRVSQTLDALRKALLTVRRQQERTWILLTVRAMVVDRTLQAVAGGSAEAYDASGQMATSRAKPILNHQRC